MAASNSEKQSSKSSDGYGSSLSPSERQKSSPASVDGGSSRWKYDVFLSFRGEDTRNNFTSHLYAALSQKGITFMDDERLERGTDFSSELIKAIEESRFSIVIFSKNYAFSTRCLEELTKIVECMVKNNHTVIPVFYDVEPSDVRKGKGKFERAFAKHEHILHNNDKVLRWRDALKSVSSITGGYELINGRSEAKCIEDIVDDIWRRLDITSGSLVEMNSHDDGLNHDDALQLSCMKAFKNKNPMDDRVNSISERIVKYDYGLQDRSSPIRGWTSPDKSLLHLSNCLPQNQNLQLHDGNKMQFGSDNKAAGRPPIRPGRPPIRPIQDFLPVMEEVQLPDSSGVQLKHESGIASQSLEHRTDVPTTSHSSPPELSKLSTDQLALPKLKIMIEKQLHEGNSRKEKILDRPSTSRFSEVKELQLPDSNVLQSADVSVTSNRPTQESPTPLIQDSSAKHEAALDTSSAATEISSDTDTDDAINVSEISQLKRLPRKLYSLKIESCKAFESLTEELMHNNLQQLYIIDCQYLKSIQASHLPIALKTLYIRRCKKLEFLSAEETTGKHTSVEHLCIESSCDPLKSFPLALFPKLRNLSISDCANFNSISITEDHNTLNSLEIRDCKNLESLWKSGFGTPKLTSILLSNCKKLKQLPGKLHELTSLQSLFIKECPELDSIPKGGLPSSLNLLRISSCHKLTPCLQWGLHQPNKFIRFEIEGGCRDLESFPEQNLLPWNLNSLQISRFPNLKVLNYEGLQHLTSLQTLKINSCDKLQFLPEEGLPSSLSYLYISECPLLKSKLQNRRGSEWYKIAHIPHIQIDGKVIS